MSVTQSVSSGPAEGQAATSTPEGASAEGSTASMEPRTSATPGATEPSAPDAGSLDRMARLRQLVRKDGKSAEEAAIEVGVDPIIAQLWLRLPDDLWPGSRVSGGANAIARPMGAGGVAPAAPASGLRRVITCRVPAPAYDRLRASETPLLEAAAVALETGLTLIRPDRSAGGWRFNRRPLAVPVTGDSFTAITELANDAFNGDMREAAGWLIARGVGMAIPLPTVDELAGITHEKEAEPAPRLTTQGVAAGRFVAPPRRRPEQRAPLPPDDSAPNGDELRKRRDAIGISQRDLAAASGLSRGLVAEVERGRRRHVLTRLRISETLASLERSK
ncbi:MAG TPA: helix-turn-helix domain-containing protein [Chloroflexota bacterium]|nr:helix-turn-helix domain-containing protein [Chloroflexota bacterium]